MSDAGDLHHGDPLDIPEQEEVKETPTTPNRIGLFARVLAAADVQEQEEILEDAARLKAFVLFMSDKIVQHPLFESVCGIVILAHFMLLAFEATATSSSVSGILIFFAIFYTLELILRASAAQFDCLWFIDLIVCMLVWLSVFISLQARSDVATLVNLATTIRLARINKSIRKRKFLPFLRPVRELVQALKGAAGRLLAAGVILGIIVIIMTTMLLALAPDAAADSEEVQEVVAEAFGGSRRVFVTLLEAMSTSDDWGVDFVLVLQEAASRGHVHSGIFLLVWMFSAFVLVLSMTGVITGVIMEEMFAASNSERHEELTNILEKTQDLMRNLENDLVKCDPDNKREDNQREFRFEEIEQCFDSPQPGAKRRISQLMAKRIFRDADIEDDGSVNIDAFIHVASRAMSSPRLSRLAALDYHQDRANQRLEDMNAHFHSLISGVTTRLTFLSIILPSVETKIQDLTQELDNVCEAERIRKRRRREIEKKAVAEAAARLGGTRHAGNSEQAQQSGAAMVEELSVDERQAHYRMHKRLQELERRCRPMQAHPDRVPKFDGNSAQLLAEAVAKTVRSMLAQELGLEGDPSEDRSEADSAEVDVSQPTVSRARV